MRTDAARQSETCAKDDSAAAGDHPRALRRQPAASKLSVLGSFTITFPTAGRNRAFSGDSELFCCQLCRCTELWPDHKAECPGSALVGVL